MSFKGGSLRFAPNGNSPWARTPKMTFRYHYAGVMLTYIFEKFIYCSFILCMIPMLNEKLNRIYHVTK